MTVRTCPHPLCEQPLKRFENACRRHYARLPRWLKDEMRTARKSRDESFVGEVEGKWAEWFESRLKGRHEIATCRGAVCGRDIIWLPTSNGTKRVPVDADTVSAEDACFQPSRHTAHWATCPNAEDFRR